MTPTQCLPPVSISTVFRSKVLQKLYPVPLKTKETTLPPSTEVDSAASKTCAPGKGTKPLKPNGKMSIRERSEMLYLLAHTTDTVLKIGLTIILIIFMHLLQLYGSSASAPMDLMNSCTVCFIR